MGGEDILDALEALPVKPGTERPAKPVRITEVIMYVTPRLCSVPATSTIRYSDRKLNSDIKIPSILTRLLKRRNEHGKPRQKRMHVYAKQTLRRRNHKERPIGLVSRSVQKASITQVVVKAELASTYN